MDAGERTGTRGGARRFAAPITAPFDLGNALSTCGHAVLDPRGFATFVSTPAAELEPLRASWSDLPPDNYLRDGGRYRRRRHSCFVVRGASVEPVAHRAHWQPVEYNALHGGIERWFEPIEPAVIAQPSWTRTLRAMARAASDLRGEQPWYVEAHQFRIDTSDGIGRPTPEGAHRDGVDLVAVVLVDRAGVKGGETRVFDADGPTGLRFTMEEPWTCLLLDDARVIHESTPIQPIGEFGHRDTLVLTLRAGAFQGPAVVPPRA
ncbi:MAG TPA: 2OG-Fe dioxygenase family protein [Caldimonas sp.]|nr:2OG-Fe dioxygenase family protein [Caldimonas sp.]